MMARSCTARVGPSACEATRNQLCLGLVDTVDGVLIGDPLGEGAHPRSEVRLGSEAEQALCLLHVREAMSDVACAVLAQSLRLEIEPEAFGQRVGDVVDGR